MRSKAQIVARFGLLAALSLVLGYFDRAIPITWLLGGAVPGIKLGLANTVLLYAVYLMDWRSSVALMLTKVFLSGFLFGSMSAILYSLSGGVLSLIVM
ncbi:MAG: Gx transporter family protein, partial [Clostridia bacterium]|nr:Gx transporter family protein [Clostridia bacterium]